MPARRSNWSIVVILFLLAFAARALTLGNVLTVDEAYHWFDRTHAFLAALERGDPAGTNLIGHPGVTTMWLGAFGLLLERALAGWLPPDQPVITLMLLRLPVAAATALCVGLAYPLLRRLLGVRVALLAGVLWAGEPFLVAFSQLLHLDALLASFMTLSILMLMVGMGMETPRRGVSIDRGASTRSTDRGVSIRSTDRGVSTRSTDRGVSAEPTTGGGAERGEGRARDGWGVGRPTEARDGRGGGRPTEASLLVFSGAIGGLAFLTKSPSLALVPMVGLIVLVAVLRLHPRWPQRVGLGLALLLAWIATAALVWVVCWPAAWADPLRLASEVIHQASSDGGAPHGWGNFFLGRAVDDPGPLFYPVALALRLTPWVSAGFLIAGIAALRLLLRGRGAELLVPGLLALFVLLFLTMMSIPPKKFDRYALPAVPGMIILAAWGWVRFGEFVWRLKNRESRTENQELSTENQERRERTTEQQNNEQRGITVPSQPIIRLITMLMLVLVLAAQLAWYAPYTIAYYNPVLGGGATAVKLIPVGWGEGHEQAGAIIDAQFNGADRPTATWYEPVLAPFVQGGTAPMDFAFEPNRVDYAVLYVDQIQRAYKPWLITPLLNERRPLAVVRIHGIDYAYIYAIGPAVEQTLEASFGPAITLQGYSIDTTALRSADLLTVTLAWEATAPPERDYTMFIHVLDETGRKVGQVDVPPGDPRAPTSIWRPGMVVGSVQQVPLQAHLPPGRYAVLIGLYDSTIFTRLPVQAPPRPPAPDDGGATLLLEWIDIGHAP